MKFLNTVTYQPSPPSPLHWLLLPNPCLLLAWFHLSLVFPFFFPSWLPVSFSHFVNPLLPSLCLSFFIRANCPSYSAVQSEVCDCVADALHAQDIHHPCKLNVTHFVCVQPKRKRYSRVGQDVCLFMVICLS